MQGKLSSRELGDREQGVLRKSIVATIVLAVVGVLFGVLASSQAILFDGAFLLADAAMTALALQVSRLLMSEGNRRFQFGYWHFEPLVVALKGCLLMLLCVYACLDGVMGLLRGGRDLDFGLALGYLAVVTALCFAMYGFERHSNGPIRSQIIGIDMQGWLISALSNLTTMAAFAAAWWMQGTRWAHLTPYADPLVLAVTAAAMFLLPLGTMARAFKDIFQIAPKGLDLRIRSFMDGLVERRGFKHYRSYVARIGRARFIEIYIVLPQDYPLTGVGQLDEIQREISQYIGEAGPQRWLTVVFTGDESLL